MLFSEVINHGPKVVDDGVKPIDLWYWVRWSLQPVNVHKWHAKNWCSFFEPMMGLTDDLIFEECMCWLKFMIDESIILIHNLERQEFV